MSELRIEIVPHGSAQYKASVELRDQVLRKPLGLQFSEDELAKEVDQTHIIASVDGALIGVLLLVSLPPKTFKMRQVAVSPEWQGKGIGTRLVSFAEEYAIRKGVCRIELHARKEAVQFYTDLAYSTIGDEFVEVGIPHFKMEKSWCS